VLVDVLLSDVPKLRLSDMVCHDHVALKRLDAMVVITTQQFHFEREGLLSDLA
jgi:hypothetical protein